MAPCNAINVPLELLTPQLSTAAPLASISTPRYVLSFSLFHRTRMTPILLFGTSYFRRALTGIAGAFNLYSDMRSHLLLCYMTHLPVIWTNEKQICEAAAFGIERRLCCSFSSTYVHAVSRTQLVASRYYHAILKYVNYKYNLRSNSPLCPQHCLVPIQVSRNPLLVQ
jgi:hypothetical protein